MCRYTALTNTTQCHDNVVFLPCLLPARTSVCAVSIVHIHHCGLHFVSTAVYSRVSRHSCHVISPRNNTPAQPGCRNKVVHTSLCFCQQTA